MVWLFPKKIFQFIQNVGSSLGLTLGSGSQTERMDIGSVTTTLNTGQQTERMDPAPSMEQSTGSQTHRDDIGAVVTSASTGSQTESMGHAEAATLPTGTQTESMGQAQSASASTGQQTESMNIGNLATTASTGSQTERMDPSAVMTRSTGSDTQSMGHAEAAEVPTGTDTQSMAGSASGSATHPQGSQTESMGHTEDATVPTGSQTESMGHTEAASIDTGSETESMTHTEEASIASGSDSQSMGGAALELPFGGGLLYDSSGNSHSGGLVGTGHTFPPSVAGALYGTDFKANSTGAIDLGTSAAIGLGNTAWTLDVKVNKTNLGAIRYIISKWDGGSAANQNYYLRLSSGVAGNDRVEFAYVDATGTPQTLAQPSGEPPDGITDISIQFDGTTLRLFINGASVTSAGGSMRAPTAVSKTFIGAIGASGSSTPQQFFDDAIIGIRISNIARHSSGGYTPDTTPWTTDANTVALYHFDGVDGEDAHDSSGNGRYGVLEGSPLPLRVTAPTSGYGLALQFNGVDDAVNAMVQGVNCGINWPNSMPNGFTARGRFRYVANGALQAIVWRSGAPTANRQWKVYIDATGKLVFQFVNVTPAEFSITGATTLTDGQTYEFECSVGAEASSNARIFLDGLQDAVSGAVARGTVADPGPLVIGKKSITTNVPTPISPFAGVIEELEVSSVQRHTANYTPGTPITPDANTLALWRFDESADPVSTLLSAEAATPLGSESASFAASASAELSDHTNTGSSTGSPAWSSPTNAQGAINGTEASTTVSAGSSANNRLNCTGLQLPATPSGWTRTGAFIRIRWRWDLAIGVPLTDSASIVLDVYNAANTTFLLNLKNRTEDSADNNQTTLVTEEYSVASLSDTDLVTNGISIRVVFAATLSAIVGGNAGVNVDAVHLVGTYTRTGLT